MHWPKNLLLIKNPQFWSDWADIQAVLPIHGLVILTKFHDSRAKIADLLLIVSLWTSAIFYYSVSMIIGRRVMTIGQKLLGNLDLLLLPLVVLKQKHPEFEFS